MKYIKTLLLTALCYSTWACTSEEGAMANPSKETENVKEGLPAGWITSKGEMKTTVSDYTEEGTTTRAEGTITNTWDDGSKIYLMIESEKVKVPVVAVYSNTFAEWSFSYDPTQSIPSTGIMVAHYFKDATTADFTGVTLNENSVVYTDSVARYSYENNTFMIGIHLRPAYFRIRLAGTSGQKVIFSGLSRATTYTVNTGEMSQKNFQIPLTASSTPENGYYYTPYVYGSWGENDSIFTELGNGELYSRSLKDSGVRNGKSVWTSMPSLNYIPRGWKKASWIFAVDLGLSVKWAVCNVGASKPEEYGGYYAWGETEEKENYSWETYKWCNGTETSITKYCTNSYSGVVDNKTTLDLEDDVAHVKWGGTWRMPTQKEFQELYDKCTRTFTTRYGIAGYTFCSENGNSIFIPYAGYRHDIFFGGRGSDIDSWSATLSESSVYAYHNGSSNQHRYYGCTVRPVCE